MSPKVLLEAILKLPPAERLQLLEDVCDSLEESGQAIPVPQWHQVELDRRLDQPAAEPGETWHEVRARLRKSS